MSGLLRRIKRSRAADAGDSPAQVQAAAPEDAPTTAEPATGAGETAATAPVIRADPSTPAGLDPGEVGAQPPTGRRGRLRRRLRYLRRARELMLRDLGGLVYEVHRTAGGDFGRHANVIGAKVERLASLDAESAAIEGALGAPRSEAVVFQPGVGGTCDFCGELYGSAARFCSHCGSPTGSAVRATPAPVSEPRPVPPMPKPPAPATGEEQTQVLAPAGPEDAPAEEKAASEQPTAPDAATGAGEAGADEKPATVDQPTAADEKPATVDQPTAADEKPATVDQPTAADEKPATADQPTAADDAAATADQPTAADGPKGSSDSARNPFSGISNGKAKDDGTPPGLSSGDPLATRESRS
jgi:hypothetical protein